LKKKVDIQTNVCGIQTNVCVHAKLIFLYMNKKLSLTFDNQEMY